MRLSFSPHARLGIASLLLPLLLTACAGERNNNSVAAASSATTSAGGAYKIGQPYQINGNWYYPHEDYSYDETGIASWYGTEFQGAVRTANGEIFNSSELTAAHKTLPLPTLARVTNLENGKSIVVRINDRGPFSGARIIDVTQRVAQLLEFEKKGTAKVRVQVLTDESKAISDALRRYGNATPSAMAAAPMAAQSNQQAAAPTKTVAPDKSLNMLTVKPVPEVHQLSVASSGQIYVQAGSFGNLDNAKKMQQQLSSVGTARITEAVVKGTKFYRVRIGPIADVPTADQTLDKVTRAGISGARTVVE